MFLQAMYNEFSTVNIQIDKDFSAKLSGYSCVGHIPETEEIFVNAVVSHLRRCCKKTNLGVVSSYWVFDYLSICAGCGKSFSRDLGERMVNPEEQRLEFRNCLTGITYWPEKPR